LSNYLLIEGLIPKQSTQLMKSIGNPCCCASVLHFGNQSPCPSTNKKGIVHLAAFYSENRPPQCTYTYFFIV